MSKKIMVVNVSGNVGKTTVAANLLYPRLAIDGVMPVLVEVETYNKSADGLPGITVVKKTGAQFRDVYELGFNDGAMIVDVGASNIVPFFKQVQNLDGAAHIFDMFVIPTTPGVKEMADTLKTIELLRAFGVNEDRVRVVFNRVIGEVELKKEFGVLWDGCVQSHLKFDFNPLLLIRETELFKDLGEMGETVASLLADDADYSQLAREVTNAAEKRRYIQRDMARRMATSVSKNLDSVFDALELV